MLLSVFGLENATSEKNSSFTSLMAFFESLETTTAHAKALQDEELLSASVKNPSLFGALVDRYQDAFLRAAMRVVNQKEEAEDIVQDAFTKIYVHANKFKKQEGASFKSWAYRIVLNTAFTHYRKAQKHREHGVEFEDPFLVEQVLASHVEEIPIDRYVINAVMEEVPEDLRSLLTAHYLDDRSYKDIAKKNKTTVSAIKMKLFRARAAFKKVLKTHEV